MVGISTPERVQVNVLDDKFDGVTLGVVVVRVGVAFAGFDVLPFSLLFFFDPTTAPTITARRAMKTMSMIIIPLFVR